MGNEQKTSTAILVDVALLAGAFLLLHWPFLDANVGLPASGFTDLRLLTQPAYVFSGRILAEGHIPWWNPYWFAGYPHFEMPESAVFYPTTLFYGWLPFGSLVELDVLGHSLLFAIGGYLLGRDIFTTRLSALALGFLLMVGPGVTPIVAGQLWAAHVWAWLPLAWLCLRRTLRRPGSVWPLALAAVVTLQWFAGHPQGLIYQLLALGAYTVFELARRRVALREPLLALGCKALAALGGVSLGLAMAAVTLLPSEHLLAHSIRSGGVTLDYFRGPLQAGPAALYDLLLLRDSPLGTLSGALSVALLAYGLFRGRGGERLVFAGVAAVCAFHAMLPDWAWEHVLRHLPGLGSGRFNVRISTVLVIVLALLTALGLDALLACRRLGRSPGREWAILALLGCIFAIPPVLEQPGRAVWIGGSAIGLTLLAALVWLRPAATPWATLAFVALLAGEGAQLHALRVQHGETRELRVDPGFRAFSEWRPGVDRTAVFEQGSGFGGRIVQNIGSLTGDRLLTGYHALMLDDYARFLNEVAELDLLERDGAGRLQQQHTATPSRDWVDPESVLALDLLNVRWLVSRGTLALPERSIRTRGGIEGRRGFAHHEIAQLDIYENLDALPAAYIVHDVEVFASDREARARLREPGFDRRGSAILTHPFDARQLAAPAQPESVVVARYAASCVELDAKLDAPGIVVLTDVFYPGWKVLVDGKAAELLRVNALVRGVLVPPGTHRIRFEYRPASLQLGITISAAGWAAWFAGVLLCWRRRA